MSKPKITIAAGIFPPDIGGPATYVVKLGNALSKKGWQVRVVCYSSEDRGQKTDDGDYGFPVWRVLRRGSRLNRYWRYFWQVVKASKAVDVIYAQGPTSAGLPAFLAAKMLRKKFIVKVVGDPAWEQAIGKGLTDDLIDEFQGKSYGGRIKRLKKIRQFVCQRADKIITPSEYLKKIVAGWGVDREKIEVIYNSVEKLETKNEKPDDMDEDIILSVGRLVKWKGFETLIKLMPELLKENPKFKLIIIGDGPERENYQLSIINYQLEDEVKLVGSVDHKAVFDYLNKATMFVLNTGYEGLPHTVLEAMRMECPVVTTRVGGNPEVVRDSENGLLVEYNNKVQLKQAILRLYKDANLRERLTKHAKQDLERFNLNKMIDKTVEVINSTLPMAAVSP